MSIRVRTVDGRLVALCAAENAEAPGDLYLDDGVHVALQEKFLRDWTESGLIHDCPKETVDLRSQLSAATERAAALEKERDHQRKCKLEAQALYESARQGSDPDLLTRNVLLAQDLAAAEKRAAALEALVREKLAEGRCGIEWGERARRALQPLPAESLIRGRVSRTSLSATTPEGEGGKEAR